jgi:hypothetical protein
VIVLLVLAGAGAFWWYYVREEGYGLDSQRLPPPAAPRTVERTQPDVPAAFCGWPRPEAR